MSNLSAFLKPTYTEKTIEIVISDRFVDDNGEPVPFIVKSLSHEAFESIRKRSYKEQVINGKKNQIVDNNLWLSRCIVESCIQPDFHDKELCNAYGTEDPYACPSKMLFEGEIQKLGRAILSLNGLDDDSPEMGDITKK
jgi:hypothetical protein